MNKNYSDNDSKIFQAFKQINRTNKKRGYLIPEITSL